LTIDLITFQSTTGRTKRSFATLIQFWFAFLIYTLHTKETELLYSVLFGLSLLFSFQHKKRKETYIRIKVTRTRNKQTLIIIIMHNNNNNNNNNNNYSNNNNKVLSFVSWCSHLEYESRRFDRILLVVIRRWGRLVTRNS